MRRRVHVRVNEVETFDLSSEKQQTENTGTSRRNSKVCYEQSQKQFE